MKRWKGWLIIAVVLGTFLFTFSRWLLQRHFQADDPSTEWHYLSTEHGYWVTVPSNEWTISNLQDTEVAFHNPKHGCLAGVNVLAKRPDAFEKGILGWQAIEKKPTDEVTLASHSERGTSRFGKEYFLSTSELRLPNGQRVWGAYALVNLPEPGIVVSVTFEARLRMDSQTGQASERKYLKNAARSICLSPREVRPPVQGR